MTKLEKKFYCCAKIGDLEYLTNWSNAGMGKIENLSQYALLNWSEQRNIYSPYVQISYDSGLNFSVKVENGWDDQSRMTLTKLNNFKAKNLVGAFFNMKNLI